MSEELVSVILGDEYDSSLREALNAVLIRKGAIEIEKNFGVGGSQEIEFQHINISGEKVIIETETFVGLSISGPKSIVESIASAVREQVKL